MLRFEAGPEGLATSSLDVRAKKFDLKDQRGQTGANQNLQEIEVLGPLPRHSMYRNDHAKNQLISKYAIEGLG